MRVVFLGNDPWSVPSVEALDAAGDIDIDLVITNPPRPAGRGSRLTSTAVADAARGLGVEILETEGVAGGAGRDAVVRLHPDAIVVVAYGEILTPEILATPRLGAVNLHFSLLPRWRGAAPVHRAILEGDHHTGVSVMLLDEGLDTGPVLASLDEAIAPDDDAGRLGERLARRGAPLLVDTLRELDAGTATPLPQPSAGATYAAKLSPGERVIDWLDPADPIVRRVRALAPVPGATTTFRGAPLKVLRAEIRDAAPAPARPGDLLLDADGTPLVAVTEATVALLEVAPAGRARMSGTEWARGARLVSGDRAG